MGIYIPDVKLPQDKKYKWDLVLHISYDGTVRSPWGNLITDGKAIELPPHGRLIDADALRSNMYDSLTKQFYINQKQIEDALTIVPADPEGGADG